LEDAFDKIKFITTYYNFLAFIKSSQSFEFGYNPRSLAIKKKKVISKLKDKNEEKWIEKERKRRKTQHITSNSLRIYSRKCLIWCQDTRMGMVVENDCDAELGCRV
jgi:hypothetical protein